jgi:hypothetical protein
MFADLLHELVLQQHQIEAVRRPRTSTANIVRQSPMAGGADTGSGPHSPDLARRINDRLAQPLDKAA